MKVKRRLLVCAHIDPQAVLAAVASLLGRTGAQPRPNCGTLRNLARDGKELRGAYRLPAPGVRAAQGVLGVYDTAAGPTDGSTGAIAWTIDEDESARI